MIVRVEHARFSARRARRIGSINDLSDLARLSLLRSLTPESPLILELPLHSNGDLKKWEARLNHEWTGCGCREGEIAALFAAGAYAFAVLMGATFSETSIWGHIGWAMLAALLAAAAGKVVGRWRSLGKFRRVVREILQAQQGGSE